MTYAEKKAAKLCVRCGEVPPEDGFVSCRPCLDKTSAARLNRGANVARYEPSSFNECCIAAGFHRSDCPTRKSENNQPNDTKGT